MSLAIDMIRHEHDMTCHHVRNPEIVPWSGEGDVAYFVKKAFLTLRA